MLVSTGREWAREDAAYLPMLPDDDPAGPGISSRRLMTSAAIEVLSVSFAIGCVQR